MKPLSGISQQIPRQRRDKCAELYDNKALAFSFRRCYPKPPIPVDWLEYGIKHHSFSLCLSKLPHGKLHFRNLNRVRMCGFHANTTSLSVVSYSFIYSHHQYLHTECHKCFLYVQVVGGLGRSKQILSSLSFKSTERNEYQTLNWMCSWRSWGQVRPSCPPRGRLNW